MKLQSSQLAVGGVGKGSISTIAVDEESGKESGKAISTVTTKKATIASTPSKRKAPPESIIEASGDPGIAAAATTLVYKLQYGGKESVEDLTGMDASSVEESSAAVSVQSEESDESDSSYLPRGAVELSDSDDDILIDVDSEEEDILRSSFPQDKSKKNLAPGGPQKPFLINCATDSEARVLMKKLQQGEEGVH